MRRNLTVIQHTKLVGECTDVPTGNVCELMVNTHDTTVSALIVTLN